MSENFVDDLDMMIMGNEETENNEPINETEVQTNEPVNSQSEISMESTVFETFLRCVSLLQDICVDIDIQNGFIRQRSNDRSTIFEIDLTPIIGNCSFPILKIKDKMPLLKLLRGNKVQLNLINNEYFEFIDNVSKFKFNIPSTEYIDNKFMSLEELTSLFQLFEDDVILSTNISSIISNRIKVVKDVYNTNNIFVEFAGDTASIFSKSDANDQYATFLNNITTERHLSVNSPLVSIPFTIDHDGDIKLEMYNHNDNISINKFKTNIDNINIVLYSRSELIENDDEE